MCVRLAVEESSCSSTARNKSSMFSMAVFSTSSASIMASPIKSLISIMALKTGSSHRVFC